MAILRTIAAKASPPSVNITLKSPRPRDADPPAVDKTTDPFDNSSLRPRPKVAKPKDNDTVWQWLGPVLGAGATIFAAIITVVWVRDNHAKSSAFVIKYPSPPPSAEIEYDEAWSNPDYNSIVAEFVVQDLQQPASVWNKIFSCWL